MTRAAFGVQVAFAVILLFAVDVGGDGQHAVLGGQGNVILLYARQFSLQHIGIGLFLHIDAEAGSADHIAHVEEVAEEAVAKHIIHRGIHQVAGSTERNHIEHKTDLLASAFAGGYNNNQSGSSASGGHSSGAIFLRGSLS